MIENEFDENISSILFSEDGFIASFEEEEPKKRGRKKGSKNSSKSLDKVAEEYLQNPTDENFQNLWTRSYYGLRQYAAKLVDNDDDVDEVTSNVYEKILTKSEQYNPAKAKFSTWFYKICYNECLALLRLKNRESPMEYSFIEIVGNNNSCAFSDDAADSYDISDKFDINEDGELYLMEREEIMKKFFDTSLNIVNNFKDEGVKNCMLERFDTKNALTLEQIAVKYNYSFSDVKNWVWKGRKLLKNEMLENYKELYEMWREVAN